MLSFAVTGVDENLHKKKKKLYKTENTENGLLNQIIEFKYAFKNNRSGSSINNQQKKN